MRNAVLQWCGEWPTGGRPDRPKGVPPIATEVKRGRDTGVKSVAKAVRLIDALAGSEATSVGVREVARTLRLNPTTAYRLLTTLVEQSVLRYDPSTSRYWLGPRVLRWAEAYTRGAELPRVAHPLLEALATETEETVHLLVADGDQGVYVDRVESPLRLRVACPVGYREPLHCSAVGKALLAHLPSERQEKIIAEGLPAVTAKTITDPVELRMHLAQIREVGCAIDDGEGQMGVRCVGAPIFGASGGVVGAVSVAGPAARLPHERLLVLAVNVRRSAAAISKRLGHPGTPASGEPPRPEGAPPPQQDHAVRPTGAAPRGAAR